MSKLQLAVWEHNSCMDTHCALCGELFEVEYASVAVVDGPAVKGASNLPKNAVAQDVCPDCMAAGPDGAAERMRQRAQDLRKLADDVEQNATEIQTIDPEHWFVVKTRERSQIAIEQLNDNWPVA